MTIASLKRSAALAAVLAFVISLVSITISTVQATRFGAQISDARLADYGPDIARYFIEARTPRSGIEEIVYSFSYPGYWRFWLQDFFISFAITLPCCVLANRWLAARRKKSNSNSTRPPPAAGEQAR